MVGLLLLITVTVLYAGYNLFIKVSGSHVPEVATTTIAATICLQLAALAISLVFVSVLLVRGGHVMQLSLGAYGWAAVAGLCIGGAEIAYFYLFGGIGTVKPMAANVAIPAIAHGGTGNDLLKAGGGPSVLVGDEGDDRVIGGRDRDILIGGLGSDLLLGGIGQDILIGGTTTHDNNDMALMDLLTEWNEPDAYGIRVDRLHNGTGATGVQLAKGVTVFDDLASDRLVGSFGTDWFFFDPLEDTTPDRRNSEATN